MGISSSLRSVIPTLPALIALISQTASAVAAWRGSLTGWIMRPASETEQSHGRDIVGLQSTSMGSEDRVPSSCRWARMASLFGILGGSECY